MIEAIRKSVARPPATPSQPPAADEAAAQRVIRIKPSSRFFSLDFRELWQYRELAFVLAMRDLKVRYKQTVIGVGWAVIQPLMTMFLFTIIFNRVLKVESEYNVPYPLFAYVGLLPWTYFASSLAQSSTSVVANGALVTKVYFPRLLIPLASITVPIVDFLVAFVVLIGMFFYYGRVPHWHAIAMPAFLGLSLMTALGIGLWLSALNVRYRDIPYALPFLTQLWLYATPVAYPVTYVPERFRWLLALNPMTGVIDGFRWTVLGKGTPHYTVFGTSAAMGAVLLLSGLVYFRRTERHFADII
jgi:homopolymeric O-antigen transport system permease protein